MWKKHNCEYVDGKCKCGKIEEIKKEKFMIGTLFMKKLFAFILVFLSTLLYVGCEEPHTHEFGEWVVV